MFSRQPLVKPGEPVDINQVLYKISGGKFRPTPGEKPGINRTYLPAFTLFPRTYKIPVKFIATARDDAARLPDNFSWHKPDDVAQYFPSLSKVKDTGVPIMSPQNQLSCDAGSAWAATTAVSDHFAIQTGVNPELGPTYLISYYNENKDFGGCTSYSLDAMLNNMAQDAGAVQETCASYKWCSNDEKCSQSPVILENSDKKNEMRKYNDSLIPSFSSIKDKCLDTDEPLKVYKTKIRSAQLLQGSDSIKRQIFYKGPLPFDFNIFPDFLLGTRPKEKGGDGWAKTGGIYAHLNTWPLGEKYTTTAGDESPYTYADPVTMNQPVNIHSAVIVGWGLAEVNNFVPKAYPGKDKIMLPFWWVRNSWGPDWNENGYFRLAMIDNKAQINSSLPVQEHSITEDGMGGVMDFEIDASYVPGPSPGPAPGPSPGPNPGPTPGPSPGPTPEPIPGPSPGPTPAPIPGPSPGPNGGESSSSHKSNTMIIVGIVIFIILMAFVFLWLRKK